jgi:hypothetical protein
MSDLQGILLILVIILLMCVTPILWQFWGVVLFLCVMFGYYTFLCVYDAYKYRR